MSTRTQLKTEFESGKKITESKMHDFLDSFLHENEDNDKIKAGVGLEPGQLTGPTATFVRNANGSTTDFLYGDIPDYWKQSQSTITNLSIGSSVTAIGTQAFDQSSGLVGDLNIPDTVLAIGVSAFFLCDGLTGTLRIGKSVSAIGDYAFELCEGVERIEIYAEQAPTIGASAFADMTSVSPAEIHVPVGATGYAISYDGLTVVYDL